MQRPTTQNIRSKILSEKILYAIIVALSVNGILAICGWICNTFGESAFTINFWNSMVSIGPVMNIVVSSMVMLNEYFNYKYRNHFTKNKVTNPEILYFLCFPLVTFLNICLLVSAINDINMSSCTGPGKISFALTCCLYYIMVLILLARCNGVYNDGEIWILNFMNMAVMVLVIGSQMVYILFNVSIEQMRVIRSAMQLYNNVSCPKDPITQIIHNMFNTLLPFMTKASVLFGLSCSIFLISPFRRNYRLVQNHKMEFYSQVSLPKKDPIPAVPIEPIVFSTVFGIVFLAANLLLFANNDKPAEYIFIVLEGLIYILLIAFSIVAIAEVVEWPFKWDHNRLFNEICVWIGLFGQLIYAFAMITNSINHLYSERSFFNFIVLFKFMMQVVQNFTQSILESLLLQTQWQRSPKNHYSRFLTAILFIMTNNLFLCASNIILMDHYVLQTINNFFSLQLFVYFIYRISVVFCVLQRIHGFFLFFVYIRFFCSNRKWELDF